ncbi:MAG: hypothetical protein F4X66_17875 [Chloroflexi bacterium]|nr:hypothetical protein [Chloroflexota bacterium]MYE41505.1 hypothetical protein [Chloroflexota bacterium]
MRRAYKAVLHGDRVEWLDGAPEAEGPVQVYITFSEISVSANPELEGRTTFELLQALADMGAFSEIDDPVAWQREIRKDRPLPFRDDYAD